MAELTGKVTVRQAYLAMFEYLRRHYERGPSGEIGSILGSLSLVGDQGSADPAALDEFLAAVDAVMKKEDEGGYDDADFKLVR